MWTDVRWRPAIEEGEPEVVDEVLRLLRRAFPLEPSLPYPWREWKELLDIAGPDLGTNPITPPRRQPAQGQLLNAGHPVLQQPGPRRHRRPASSTDRHPRPHQHD